MEKEIDKEMKKKEKEDKALWLLIPLIIVIFIILGTIVIIKCVYEIDKIERRQK